MDARGEPRLSCSVACTDNDLPLLCAWRRAGVWVQAVGRETLRHGHSATVIDPHHLLIFGGASYVSGPRPPPHVAAK
jgi:hypothetical protein